MYDKVIHFWFHQITPAQWYEKDPVFDEKIKTQFSDLHKQAAQGELWEWRKEPTGRLAEIILLDQFSRNIYRNEPQAFAYDTIALVLAQEAISTGADLKLPLNMRSFLYMPFMHSESKAIHTKAVELFDVPGLEESLDYELRHKVIIDQYNRYPHRNAILGRTSTEEELTFLQQENSSF